jgi:hypothetical protein
MSGTWNSMLWSTNPGINVCLLSILHNRVCGTIVKTNFIIPSVDFVFDNGLEQSRTPDKFTLDDGTATIVVTCSPRIRNRADADLLKIGTTATVIGEVQMRKDSKLVECEGYRQSHQSCLSFCVNANDLSPIDSIFMSIRLMK